MSDKEDNEKVLAELLKNGNLSEITKDVLSRLTAHEAKVLKMRFGIDVSENHSLEEVGKQFDVTRERIRAIEEEALRKLRKNDDNDGSDAA